MKVHELTAVSVSVSVAVSPMAVDSGSCSNLHFQLFALRGVCWHGVTVVGPQATLALGSDGLSQLIGCVRAGAPAAQTSVLPFGETWVSIKWPHLYSNK